MADPSGHKEPIKNAADLMRSYNLKIAGYIIRFETSPDGPELIPSDRFLRYIADKNVPDVLIRIHYGLYDLPGKAERVFHAPYVEEINGMIIQNLANFWSVWKLDSDLFIRTIFPLSSYEKNAVLKFSPGKMDWDLWIDSPDKEIDPFEYPLDGLILYYLTVIHKDIMIHASGINYSGKGYLFCGISGRGKSTIAKLWQNAGSIVIHDDRLIIRSTSDGYRMFNTPVYSNDEPRDSSLDKIFIIEHGSENNLLPVKEASAVSLILANCIQHNWNSDIIGDLLTSVSGLCGTISTKKLTFKPDRSVVDYILEYETESYPTTQ